MFFIISYSSRKSKIYDEFDSYETYDNNEYWFNFKSKKFIHNIDTFYYVAYVKSQNYNEDHNVLDFISYLDAKKTEAMDSLEEIHLSWLGESFFTSGLGFGMYAYSIEKKDKYIIFVSKRKATEDTPEIFIQIRSQNLWLNGEHEAVKDSYDDLVNVLSKFNIKIEKTVENRIDYAFHTNYIQDMLNFFKEENLNKMQVSRFTRWHKEGKFVGDIDVECDYLSLGRRKSNNTFIRIYNKTQEVVNQQYKQFFIKIWLLNGLINRYDYYVLEKCFSEGSYNYVDRARLEFYLDYGSDQVIKDNIIKFLKSSSTLEIRDLANKLTPFLTIVCNVEIQTKRKFYATMDKSINLLNAVTFKELETERLFKILDNKDLFIEFITEHVIRFVDYGSRSRKKDCLTADWWIRLQTCNLNNVINDDNRILLREYQRDLDVKVLKQSILRKISTVSLYMKNENDDTVIKDITDFLSFLNESDISKNTIFKHKKTALLKNQLQNLESLAIDKTFIIVDSETAEILN